MFRKNEVVKVITDFKNNAEEMFKTSCKDDVVAYMKENKAQEISDFCNKVKNCAIASIPEGYAVPNVSVYVNSTGTEEEIKVINLSVNHKVTSDFRFKFAYVFTALHVEEDIKDAFIEVYETLLINQMAAENLKKVNEVMEIVTEKAGVDYKVSFVTPLKGDGKIVERISDDEVVFVADEEKVFEVENLLITYDADKFVTQEMIDEAIDLEADKIALATSTVKLVAQWGSPVIKYICNLNKQVKPMTIIKKAVTKNIIKVRGKKEEIGYFTDDDIFAIVAKRPEGYEVILSPFEIETFDAADLDVIKEIKKAI